MANFLAKEAWERLGYRHGQHARWKRTHPEGSMPSPEHIVNPQRVQIRSNKTLRFQLLHERTFLIVARNVLIWGRLTWRRAVHEPADIFNYKGMWSISRIYVQDFDLFLWHINCFLIWHNPHKWLKWGKTLLPTPQRHICFLVCDQIVNFSHDSLCQTAGAGRNSAPLKETSETRTLWGKPVEVQQTSSTPPPWLMCWSRWSTARSTESTWKVQLRGHFLSSQHAASHKHKVKTHISKQCYSNN